MPPTKKMCNKVQDLLYSDSGIQVEEIAQALGISHDSISTILHDSLGMHKLTAHWVPKSLSDEQMATRAWVPEAKEVQDTTICWQGDGHSILECKRCYYVGLFTQKKYNNWSILCKVARPAKNGHL